jgi:M-phase inducer tyrosine phosphatase
MITSADLVQFLKNNTVVILDCRFQYEYEGGHIIGALWQGPDTGKLNDLYVRFRAMYDSGVIIVFHCEFSQTRGPACFQAFRQIDRTNSDRKQYGEPFFSRVYVLEGGYKKFYTTHAELCTGGYRPMDNADISKIRHKVKPATALTAVPFRLDDLSDLDLQTSSNAKQETDQ